MSDDKASKQQKIDDMLLSIDSLLDTAQDVSLDDSTAAAAPAKKSAADTKKIEPKLEKPTTPVKKSTPPKKTTKPKAASQKKTQANTVASENSKTSKQPPSSTTTSTNSNEVNTETKPSIMTDSIKAETTPMRKTPKPVAPKPIDKPAKAVLSENRKPKTPQSKPSVTDNDASPEIETQAQAKKDDVEQDLEVDSNKDKVTDATQEHIEHTDEDTDQSLAFTTVDDDLNRARQELPVLDDIVTHEDLALIGSGKEPPKKILTEKFQRKTTTDKIIDILENQLSEYSISKLEYKYLHELIDDVLEEKFKNLGNKN